MVLSVQIGWSEAVDSALKSPDNGTNALQSVLKGVEGTLTVLADSVLHDQPVLRRRKLENLIIEHVHQRDVTRNLVQRSVNSAKAFE